MLRMLELHCFSTKASLLLSEVGWRQQTVIQESKSSSTNPGSELSYTEYLFKRCIKTNARMFQPITYFLVTSVSSLNNFCFLLQAIFIFGLCIKLNCGIFFSLVSPTKNSRDECRSKFGPNFMNASNSTIKNMIKVNQAYKSKRVTIFVLQNVNMPLRLGELK